MLYRLVTTRCGRDYVFTKPSSESISIIVPFNYKTTPTLTNNIITLHLKPNDICVSRQNTEINLILISVFIHKLHTYTYFRYAIYKNTIIVIYVFFSCAHILNFVLSVINIVIYVCLYFSFLCQLRKLTWI